MLGDQRQKKKIRSWMIGVQYCPTIRGGWSRSDLLWGRSLLLFQPGRAFPYAAWVFCKVDPLVDSTPRCQRKLWYGDSPFLLLWLLDGAPHCMIIWFPTICNETLYTKDYQMISKCSWSWFSPFYDIYDHQIGRIPLGIAPLLLILSLNLV